MCRNTTISSTWRGRLSTKTLWTRILPNFLPLTGTVKRLRCWFPDLLSECLAVLRNDGGVRVFLFYSTYLKQETNEDENNILSEQSRNALRERWRLRTQRRGLFLEPDLLKLDHILRLFCLQNCQPGLQCRNLGVPSAQTKLKLRHLGSCLLGPYVSVFFHQRPASV